MQLLVKSGSEIRTLVQNYEMRPEIKITKFKTNTISTRKIGD